MPKSTGLCLRRSCLMGFVHRLHCTRLLGPTQKRSCATKKPPWLDHAPVKLVYIFTQLDRSWDKSYMRGCVSSLAGTLICGWPTEIYRRKIYLPLDALWCGFLALVTNISATILQICFGVDCCGTAVARGVIKVAVWVIISIKLWVVLMRNIFYAAPAVVCLQTTNWFLFINVL